MGTILARMRIRAALFPGRNAWRYLRISSEYESTFLDLFHFPDAPAFVEEMRKERDRVLSAHNGEWTKDALDELVLVDSAIKESMRLSVRVIGMHRMVSRSPSLHGTAIDLAPGDCPK